MQKHGAVFARKSVNYNVLQKNLSINISNPCTENWDEMTPADKGRFCNSCQKTVIDFTMLTDAEIISIIKTTSTNSSTCGRFHESQVNRQLIVPKPERFHFGALKKLAASFILFHAFVTTTWAQKDKHKTYQRAKTTDKNKHNTPQSIRGRVIDHVTMQPLPGVIVEVDGLSLTATSDNSGHFHMPLPIHFDQKSITLRAHNNTAEIDTSANSTFLNETIAIDSSAQVIQVTIYRYPLDYSEPISITVYKRPPMKPMGGYAVPFPTVTPEPSAFPTAPTQATSVDSIRTSPGKTLWQKITSPFRKHNKTNE